MVNNITNTIRTNWLKEVEGRTVWAESKKGTIELINRDDYSRSKYNSCRFQRILQVMTKELNILSDKVLPNDIETLVNLNNAVNRRYKNYREAHSTPFFGWLYLLIFAFSIQKGYQAFSAAIQANFKKQLSSLKDSEFEKAIESISLSDINLDQLTSEQIDKVIDKKINNFDSLSEKDKSILIDRAKLLSDNQFDQLFKKASFKSLDAKGLSTSKKEILVKNGLDRLKTLLKEDLKVLSTLTPVMTEEQFKRFINKADSNSFDKSILSGEQLGICLEKGKISLNSLTSQELIRFARFIPSSQISKLAPLTRESLINEFSSAQILDNWKLWKSQQRNNINLYDWSEDEILLLSQKDCEGINFNRVSLVNWDLDKAEKLISNLQYKFLYPAKLILNCSNWPEKLFQRIFGTPKFYHVEIDKTNIELDLTTWQNAHLIQNFFNSLGQFNNARTLPKKFIEKNLSVFPDMFIYHLSSQQIRSLSYENIPKKDIAYLLEHLHKTVLRDVPAVVLNDHLDKISVNDINDLPESTLLQINANGLSYRYLLQISSYAKSKINVSEINLRRFERSEVTSLLDSFFHEIRKFKVADCLHLIEPRFYRSFSHEQCTKIKFVLLTPAQKKAFKIDQKRVMEGYSVVLDTTESAPEQEKDSFKGFKYNFNDTFGQGFNWSNKNKSEKDYKMPNEENSSAKKPPETAPKKDADRAPLPIWSEVLNRDIPLLTNNEITVGYDSENKYNQLKDKIRRRCSEKEALGIFFPVVVANPTEENIRKAYKRSAMILSFDKIPPQFKKKSEKDLVGEKTEKEVAMLFSIISDAYNILLDSFTKK